jgi:hypothetical protein
LRHQLERFADRLVLGESGARAKVQGKAKGKASGQNARCRTHGAGDAITEHVASLRYSTPCKPIGTGQERPESDTNAVFGAKARTKVRAC